MTSAEQTTVPPSPGTTGVSAEVSTAFARELHLRLTEARASLAAAESLDDPLLAQIAEADLADLHGLALRNDVDPDAAVDATP